MSFERRKYNAIGTAVINDIDDFFKWLDTEEGKYFADARWSDTLYQRHKNVSSVPENFKFFYNLQDKLPFLHDSSDLYKNSWRKESLKEDYEYLKILGLPFDLLYEGEDYAVICSNQYAYLIPSMFLTNTRYKDYDDISVSSLCFLGADKGTSLIPAGTEEISVNGIKSSMQEKEDQIAGVRDEVEKLNKEKEEKLRQLKEELEKTYQDKFSLIEKKKAELQEKQRELEQQLLVLDTEIYGIRCYNGEAVKFVKIKDGTAGKPETPVVIHQKIRYLDEEMGKLLSIYEFDGSNGDLKYFEKAVAEREDIRDIFLPQEKCICFVKISRSGLIHLPSQIIANMLETYEKYHGKTIGVLIRNGGQLYIGWTSEDRVDIHDEKAFYGNRQSIDKEEEVVVNTSSSRTEMISRYFIYAILQGILDDGKILSVPEKVNVIKPNPYIILSMADGWIEDNRFGYFSDIVDRTQRPFIKGDMILTTMHITRDDIYEHDYRGTSRRYEKWNNDRGRGERNRTHDASLSDCTIYPVNCIDRTDSYTFYYLQYPWIAYEEDTPDRTKLEMLQGPPRLMTDIDIDVKNHELWGMKMKNMTPEEIYEAVKEKAAWAAFDEPNKKSGHFDGELYKKACLRAYFKTELKDTQFEYFLSAEKEANWLTGKTARANLQIFSDEVLNLTFLNSVWVRYAINNRKVGCFKIGNKTVDYAQSIRYLNKALTYLDEREKTEAELLSKYMELYDDWQVDLSEWKLKNDIHVLTDTRAKKFAAEHKENNINAKR